MCWGAVCQVPRLTSDECRVLSDGMCIERANVGELGVKTGLGTGVGVWVDLHQGDGA